MAKTTTEHCDICWRDVTNLHGAVIYRGRLRHWWHWHGREEPWGKVTFCDDCMDALGNAVREAREARLLTAGPKVDAAPREGLSA